MTNMKTLCGLYFYLLHHITLTCDITSCTRRFFSSRVPSIRSKACELGHRKLIKHFKKR